MEATYGMRESSLFADHTKGLKDDPEERLGTDFATKQIYIQTWEHYLFQRYFQGYKDIQEYIQRSIEEAEKTNDLAGRFFHAGAA